MSELKPCPFCGGEATVSWGKKEVHVYCTTCGIKTPSAYCKSRRFVKLRGGRNFIDGECARAWVVKLWNTRKSDGDKIPWKYAMADGELR